MAQNFLVLITLGVLIFSLVLFSNEAFAETFDFKGKYKAKFSDGEFKSKGKYWIDDEKFKKIKADGTFEINELIGDCDGLVAHGTIHFTDEDTILVDVFGTLCEKKHKTKLSGIYEITGGTGKFEGAQGEGEVSQAIGKKHFVGNMKGTIILSDGTIEATDEDPEVSAQDDIESKKYDYTKKHDFEPINEDTEAIILFKDDVTPTQIVKLQSMGLQVDKVFDIIPGVATKVDQAYLDFVKDDNAVEYVFADTKVHTSLIQSVPQISADIVHSFPITGQGVVVCIIDTGVDDTHSAIPTLIAEQNFVAGYLDPNDATDDDGHGTHVAGIVASALGVAPDASLMAAKVLDQNGDGLTSDVIQGIDWCVTNGADVINLSLGGGLFSGPCDAEPDAIAVNNAFNSGVVVVAASSNDFVPNAISQPACASNAIAVGAVDKSDLIAGFSNRGTELDVVAPGVDIVSVNAPINGGGFVSADGTSMATPHVAGLAALLLEAVPSLNPQQVSDTIKSTANDLGCVGFDTIYGTGRINAESAYLVATGQSPLPDPGPGPYTGPVLDGTLYTISPFDDLLRTVDSTSGCPVSSIPITLSGQTVTGGTGLAIHPVTSEMYALLKLQGQGNRYLVTIDPQTGIATAIGNTGQKLAGIAFDDSGNLFGVHGDNNGGGGASQAALFSVDINNANSNSLCSLGNGDFGETIGYRSFDSIYHGSGLGNVIFEKVNEQTCGITDIPLSDISIGESNALTYLESEDKFLWAQGFGGNNLYTLTNTGTVEFIGTLNHASKGLGFIPTSVDTCGISFASGNVANFGQIPRNQQSSEQLLRLENTGQIDGQLFVRGTDWIDDSSNVVILADNTRFSTVSGIYYSKIPITISDSLVVDPLSPSNILDFYMQLEANMENPSFLGTLTQNLDFSIVC